MRLLFRTFHLLFFEVHDEKYVEVSRRRRRDLLENSTSDDEGNRRFWQEEEAEDEVIPVLVGLSMFALMCIGLGLWFGRKWLKDYCQTRHQTAPVPQGPILMRR